MTLLRGNVDRVTALCFLEMGESSSDTIEHALEIDVDHAVPLLDLEESKRRDRHNAGIVHQDVNLAIRVDCFLY
jgi:hypothetical protein